MIIFLFICYYIARFRKRGIFHIHTEGTKDKLYVPGKQILVNDKFNNRLHNMTYRCSYIAKRKDFPYLFQIIDYVYEYNNIHPVGEATTLSEVLECFNSSDRSKVPTDEILKLSKESFRMLRRADIAKREMAMEEYRRNNTPDRPSRVHSLYACNDEGLEYWINTLENNNHIEAFRIDPIEEPFQTNEQLLPDEKLTFEDMVTASMRYFNPRKKDIGIASDEFLVKVKILEKVYDSKKDTF
ncbi:MAG: DUF2441 domain-containing protein [Bacilli bacterium]|nr:DUF2441 domain-containing protein [Bacilli bacterium]